MGDRYMGQGGSANSNRFRRYRRRVTSKYLHILLLFVRDGRAVAPRDESTTTKLVFAVAANKERIGVVPFTRTVCPKTAFSLCLQTTVHGEPFFQNPAPHLAQVVAFDHGTAIFFEQLTIPT